MASVVFDQDNFNVLIAQAANCGTNVVPIGSGPDAVPSIVGACKYITSLSTHNANVEQSCSTRYPLCLLSPETSTSIVLFRTSKEFANSLTS